MKVPLDSGCTRSETEDFLLYGYHPTMNNSLRFSLKILYCPLINPASFSSSSKKKMLLQTAISSPLQPHPSLFTSIHHFFSQIQLGFHPNRTYRNRNKSIYCKARNYGNPLARSYGKVSSEENAEKRWKELSWRISLLDDPSRSTKYVLDQWEYEGKWCTRWELCRCVKELRKCRKYKLALEVYDWMNNEGDKFRLTSRDAAIQLDLIAKVHGISRAKDYFSKLPRSWKDMRTHSALLNAYVQANMREEAEFLFEVMRDRSFAQFALPFNSMLTLYTKLEEYEKVMALITEMLEENIQLSLWSYNIWITTCGALGRPEVMERVVERMKRDRLLNPTCATYITMATMYIKLGLTEKAKECLKEVETRITARDRMTYHFLLSLYSTLGEKEDVYRIWNIYQSSFSSILNLGYKAMIAALLRLDDIDGAERIYNVWLLVRTSYDPIICNLLIGWYVKKGLYEKAQGFVDQVLEVPGGKVNADTWMLIAQGHIENKQIWEALSCIKVATTAEQRVIWWPNPTTVCAFISLCEQEADFESKAMLFKVLKKVKCFKDELYRLSVERSDGGGTDFGSKPSMDRNRIDADSDDDGTNMLLLNELEEN